MTKMKFSKKAYNVLTEDERMALNLQIVGGKSSWDAGEIIKRAHYKYLEISQRGKKYLELFTAYFNHFDELIPEEVNMHPGVAEYFNRTMLRRMKVSEAATQKDYPGLLSPIMRDRYITMEIEKLKQSRSVRAVSLLELIMEFDRHNNFRILPIPLQEPSAFKRRHKNLHKKQIRQVCSLTEDDVEYIRKQYGNEGQGNISAQRDKNTLYVSLITDVEAQLYVVIPVSNKPHVVEYFTKRCFYMFSIMEDAGNLCKAIVQYKNLTVRHCRDGQNFWPYYRSLIKKASNYNELNNLPPDRSLSFVMDPKIEARGVKVGKEIFGVSELDK